MAEKRFWSHASREKGMWRWWLHDRKRGGSDFASLQFFWGGSRLTGVSFGHDDEHGWGGSLRLYLVQFYWHLNIFPRIRGPEGYPITREINISFHDGGVWWSFWRDGMGWSSKESKWRVGNFNFVDALLGRTKFSERVIEERDVLIPMPEKSYPAHVKFTEDTWKRPRWFPHRLTRVNVEIPEGIPHAGKGTCEWNCGDDATFGMTCAARSVADGVGKVVGSCLETRVRYGGWGDYSWSRALPGTGASNG